MSSDIPQWVRLACSTWGNQKRRIWSGMDWHGNTDGYANSLLGRIREERDGAGQGQRSQYWREVFSGDGLAVHLAIPGMPIDPNDVLHLKYVWDPRFKLHVYQKAKLLGISERAFLEAAKRAETWIQARLDSSAQPQVLDVSRKILQESLKKPLRPVQNQAYLIKAPELSFEALHRPVLSLK